MPFPLKRLQTIACFKPVSLEQPPNGTESRQDPVHVHPSADNASAEGQTDPSMDTPVLGGHTEQSSSDHDARGNPDTMESSVNNSGIEGHTEQSPGGHHHAESSPGGIGTSVEI